MGNPNLASQAVPMSITPPIEHVVRYPLHLGGDVLEVTCLSMGNPQCIIFVTDLNAVNLEEIGPLIEDHPIFPDRANVEFARVISRDEIEIRIWERGAGYTRPREPVRAHRVAAALKADGSRVRVRTEVVLRVDCE